MTGQRSSLRLDRHDAASYMRGRHNSNQRAGIDYSLIDGTAALLPTPQRSEKHDFRPGKYLTIYVNGEPTAAKIVIYGMNPFEAEVQVMYNGTPHWMTVETLKAMTRTPQPDVNIPRLLAVNPRSLGTWEQHPSKYTVNVGVIYGHAPNAMSAIPA